MPIVNPFELSPLALGQELRPEDLYLEPPASSDEWFRASYARALALSASIFSGIPGRESDPLIGRADRNGIQRVNNYLKSNRMPNQDGGESNRMPSGLEEPEKTKEKNAGLPEIIPCQKGGRLEENIVPEADTPPRKFRGGHPAEKYTSLREITFSGLRELRAEDPTWEVVSGLGPGVGVGNWGAPKLVIVGGEPTDSGEGIYPFYSRAGGLLFQALRTIGWDECDLFLCNSVGPDGSRHTEELRALHDAFAHHDPVWIALGAVAARVVKSFPEEIRILRCEHPAWHQKVRSKESPRDYARFLQESGLPGGDSFDLAVHPVDQDEVDRGVAFDLADAFDLPPSIWVQPEAPTPSGSKRRHITKAKSDVARVAFVTGEVSTLRKAADLAKCSYTHLLVIAKKEGWKDERDRHQDMVRERSIAKSVDRESAEIATARVTAWSAAVKAVDIVNRRLESGKYLPNAMDAARLVSMALDLTKAADVGAEHERERVRNRTIAQIGKDLVQTLQSQFGKDVIDVKAVVRSEPDESS